MDWRSTAVFFPHDADAKGVLVGAYRFRDETAFNAALACAETEMVKTDVLRFTDATVARCIGTQLLPPST